MENYVQIKKIVTSVVYPLAIVILLSSCAIPQDKNISPPASKAPAPPPKNDFVVQSQCVQILQDHRPRLNGILLFERNKQGETPSSYLLNMSTRSQTDLDDVFPQVSPDGKKYAYRDVASASIVIKNMKDESLETLLDSNEKLSIAYWADNNHLVLNKRRTEYGDLTLLPSVIIFDLMSGEQQELLPEYPNINDHPKAVNWVVGGRIVISPSSEYLAYPAWEDGLPVILWDRKAQHEIARVHNGDRQNTPWWSPNGEQFVISAPPRIETYKNADDNLPFVGGQELFLVDQAGKIQRLTYFTTTDKTWQSRYNWSPNGDQIAFLLQQEKENEIPGHKLMVVDVSTRKVTDYCINASSWLWINDESYIVVNHMDENLDISVILIDRISAHGWIIAKDASATGWLIDE